MTDKEVNETLCLFLEKTPIDYNADNATEKIVEKWEKLGFLDGLGDDIKKCIATTFENLSHHIIENKEKYTYWFCVTVFPMIHQTIRRNYEYTGKAVTPEIEKVIGFLSNTTINDIHEYIEQCKYNSILDFNKFDLSQKLINLEHSHDMDTEAELTAMIAELMAKSIFNN